MEIAKFFSKLHWFEEPGGALGLWEGSSLLFQVSTEALKWASRSGDKPLGLDAEFDWLRSAGFIPDVPPAVREPVVDNLYLNLVYGCNLGCDYCNVLGGTYGESKLTRMSVETALHALDVFLAPSRAPIFRLSYFGGEPLLNWPVLRASAERARQVARQTLEIEVYTNGVALTREMADFFAAHQVSIQVSLDGPREVHDKHRQTRDGQGTYDKVLASIDCLTQAGVQVRTQATVTADSPLKLAEVEDYLRSVVPEQVDVCAYPEESTLQSCGEGIQLMNERRMEEFNTGDGRAPNAALLAALLCGVPQTRLECVSGLSQIWVAPGGELHPCRLGAMLGNEFKMGSVWDAEPLRSMAPLKNRFMSISEPCSKHWARALCTRGCHYTRSRKGIDRDQCCREAEGVESSVRMAARLDLERIEKIFHSVTSTSWRQSIRRAYGLRSAVWARYRHLKPVAIFPVGRGECTNSSL